MNTKITGQEAYDMMLVIMENKPKIKEHFYHNSELWKAIKEHIISDDRSIIFIKDEIISYRGTGPSILLTNVYAYPPQYSKNEKIIPTVFCMEITINTTDDDNYTHQKDFKLDVPIDLLINFSKEKFDKWVRIESVANLKRTTEKIMNIIIENLPSNIANKILEKIN